MQQLELFGITAGEIAQLESQTEDVEVLRSLDKLRHSVIHEDLDEQYEAEQELNDALTKIRGW